MQRLERHPSESDLEAEAPQGLVRGYERYIRDLDDPKKAYLILVGAPDEMARYLLSRFHQLRGQAFVSQVLAYKAAQTVESMRRELLSRVFTNSDHMMACAHVTLCIEPLDERSLAVVHQAVMSINIVYVDAIDVDKNRSEVRLESGHMTIQLPKQNPTKIWPPVLLRYQREAIVEFFGQVVALKRSMNIFPTLMERLTGGLSANVEDNRSPVQRYDQNGRLVSPVPKTR